ncbi:hypothetical protein [Aquimarina pacifica]|uniref:hypothetical protein n=1 Tax=Aquimarina pacifica TaxID=1296415 RepID=UPI00046E7366|nr:hypothetical protein [Aquimarina pacifica]
MGGDNNYTLEANRITNYLISKPLLNQERVNYCEAMRCFDIELTDYEEMLLSIMLKSKWKMACIDAGLALRDPGNVVRRKIFTMLAILEASPNYTSCFLSSNFNFFQFVTIIFVGCRSVVRAFLGIIIIKNIKNRCS